MCMKHTLFSDDFISYSQKAPSLFSDIKNWISHFISHTIFYFTPEKLKKSPKESLWNLTLSQ